MYLIPSNQGFGHAIADNEQQDSVGARCLCRQTSANSVFVFVPTTAATAAAIPASKRSAANYTWFGKQTAAAARAFRSSQSTTATAAANASAAVSRRTGDRETANVD